MKNAENDFMKLREKMEAVEASQAVNGRESYMRESLNNVFFSALFFSVVIFLILFISSARNKRKNANAQ